MACALSGFAGCKPSASGGNVASGSPAPSAAPNPSAKADLPPAIAIPEVLITLRRELQFKDGAGNTAFTLPAGEKLISESTQGLEYIVLRNGLAIRIHCDDASEGHARFSDGRVEHLAAQMAQEIRTQGKVPTNERIVARAAQALEDHRLEGDPAELATEVENLQKALLLHPDIDTAPNP